MADPHPLLTDACLDAALGPAEARSSAPLRFFHHRVPEGLLRAPPWSPYALWVPVLLALFGHPGLAAARPGWALGLGLVAAGWLSWTLVEYALHRGIFHWRARSAAGRVAGFLLHGHHHRTPSDRWRLVATPAQSLSLLALLVALDRWVVAAWVPLFAGQIAGYLVYEWVHYSAHHRRPRTALGRALRRHHLHHHLRHRAAGDGNYGISSPLWDWVLGSVIPPRASPQVDR